jgi:hypothetical protein
MDFVGQAITVLSVDRRRQPWELQSHLKHGIIFLPGRGAPKFGDKLGRDTKPDAVIQSGTKKGAGRIVPLPVFHQIKKDVEVESVKGCLIPKALWQAEIDRGGRDGKQMGCRQIANANDYRSAARVPASLGGDSLKAMPLIKRLGMGKIVSDFRFHRQKASSLQIAHQSIDQRRRDFVPTPVGLGAYLLDPRVRKYAAVQYVADNSELAVIIICQHGEETLLRDCILVGGVGKEPERFLLPIR